MNTIIIFIATFLGCVGFSIMFNLRGKINLLASFGGVIGYAVFLLFSFTQNDIMQYFLATIAIEIYAEILARVFKQPVTIFLIVALLPLVPGGGIYYTMEYCINGNIGMFIEEGLHTFFIAGSLVGGIIVVSSVVRLIDRVKHHIHTTVKV
ncbi:threonine/serine exporter family protein [Paludicola sp. MB14-C6]|uniref:threonine/serine exporter family protein n=1 Tax=Paludihabitans sp. MB14-C6 TaxID=3070656 RepID=UPI0027DDEBDA|nr:threonine/serine exporter family protein [Paludicola sp. MB14-C6]WMJ22734.1 threonine/serine exporter family protein [Paludicola sp. MB14-C6]